MRTRTTPQFWKMFDRPPIDVQERAEKAFQLWLQNPRHNSLQFKKLKADPPLYSARIDLDYRAVGIRHGEIMTWIWIGNHRDYEKLLS